MKTSFADYCATADAREKIAANVLEWSQMLCLSLEQNFVEESIRRQKFFAAGRPEELWMELYVNEDGDLSFGLRVGLARFFVYPASESARIALKAS